MTSTRRDNSAVLEGLMERVALQAMRNTPKLAARILPVVVWALTLPV
jgi:hypothetical protein